MMMMMTTKKFFYECDVVGQSLWRELGGSDPPPEHSWGRTSLHLCAEAHLT